jgi:hypothetical protein
MKYPIYWLNVKRSRLLPLMLLIARACVRKARIWRRRSWDFFQRPSLSRINLWSVGFV